MQATIFILASDKLIRLAGNIEFMEKRQKHLGYGTSIETIAEDTDLTLEQIEQLRNDRKA